MAAQEGTKVIDVTTEAEFAQHMSSLSPSTLAVIYFHAPWAPPCKQMSDVVKALASTFPTAPTSSSPASIAFLSLNAEDVADVSEKYDVTAVPYIVLEKGGIVVDTVSGNDASKVRAAVEKHVGGGLAGNSGLPPAQSVTKPDKPDVATGAGVGGAAHGTNGVESAESHAHGGESEAGAGGKESKEELFKRLEGLTKSAPVMLFIKGTPSAPQCGFSRQVVTLLRNKSVRYGFFNILADDDVRQGLKEYGDWPTFPQLWVEGELVGGLDIVKEEFENDAEFLSKYSVKKEAAVGS